MFCDGMKDLQTPVSHVHSPVRCGHGIESYTRHFPRFAVHFGHFLLSTAAFIKV
jgi:hypothetical protein